MLLRAPLLFLLALLFPAGRAQTLIPAAPGRHFFLDCSVTRGGDGRSPQSAWNSVVALNAESFLPGDVISIRRGTSCHGSLSPSGSGADGAPIRLTAYGEGTRPRIVADPDAKQALRLFNQQNWEVDSLDLSGGRLNGVFISGDSGILHHIHLANLAVHDVMGGTMKHKESGLVAVSPTSAACHFDDVLIDDVVAWNTNQWVGIMVGGGDVGYPPESDWSSNVVIRNSVIHNVQGDGIVLFRVRNGTIESSVAWNTGMQQTESIGTPNAIWTWMCNDCTVRDSEAFLTDSPGVDGGAFDIDYGNTKNSVIDNYGHDTQGYCVAVFGAGFVTRDSLVRGNLCINNGRSPRMADYQGAIFIYTWNGGSIDSLTIDQNEVYWNPFENAPAVLNNATIAPGNAVFRQNQIWTTASRIVDSNSSLSLSQNHYRYYGSGNPQFRYGQQRYAGLQALQQATHQEDRSMITPYAMHDWQEPRPVGIWKLTAAIPVSLGDQGVFDRSAMNQIVALRSQAQQYIARGLQVSIDFTSPEPKIFDSTAFRNALADLDLDGITVTHTVSGAELQIALQAPSGGAGQKWVVPVGFVGPVPLGRALRNALGEPYYSQMSIHHDDE
jgi:hypothetical protein